MYHPSQEMAQLPKVPQIENGKPDFSPTFQKVELHNSTFSNQQHTSDQDSSAAVPKKKQKNTPRRFCSMANSFTYK